MRFQLFTFFLLIVISFAGCNGEETPDNSNLNKTGNGNSNTIAAVPSVEPSREGALTEGIVTPTPTATVEAVTLKPLIDAFCSARRANDETALRKLYSAATLKNLLSETQAEGKTKITEYLSSEPVGDNCKVVNERIVGDTGEANVITKTYPKGIRWTFVKEGGEWKFTDQSSDFQKVKQNK